MTLMPRRFAASVALMGMVAGALMSTPAAAQELCGRRVTEPIAVHFDRLVKLENAKVVSRDASFIVVEDKARNYWTFTVSGHPAHPSVACRQLVQSGGSFSVRTDLHCQAAEPACKKLLADFQLLDKRMQEAIQKDLQKKKAP